MTCLREKRVSVMALCYVITETHYKGRSVNYHRVLTVANTMVGAFQYMRDHCSKIARPDEEVVVDEFNNAVMIETPPDDSLRVLLSFTVETLIP